jgi:outer membrane immunogenic protein
MKFAKWMVVIGGVAPAVLATWSAHAADLTPYPAPPPPSYIPARYLWTGFYLGVAAGGGFGTASFFDPFNGGTTGSNSLSGFLVGGYTGLNYQINYVVLGVEGDFTGSWAHGTTADTAGDAFKTEVLWTASVTGRFGVAFDRVLLFGKGGAAFTYHRDTVTLATTTGQSPIGSAYPVGWTVGGGLDWAVTDHWIARLEYDYLHFPTRAVFLSAPALAGAGVAAGSAQVGVNLNEVKGGIAYKF